MKPADEQRETAERMLRSVGETCIGCGHPIGTFDCIVCMHVRDDVLAILTARDAQLRAELLALVMPALRHATKARCWAQDWEPSCKPCGECVHCLSHKALTLLLPAPAEGSKADE